MNLVTSIFLFIGLLGLVSCSTSSQEKDEKKGQVTLVKVAAVGIPAERAKKDLFLAKSRLRLNSIMSDVRTLKSMDVYGQLPTRVKGQVGKLQTQVLKAKTGLRSLGQVDESNWNEEKREFLKTMQFVEDNYAEVQSLVDESV